MNSYNKDENGEEILLSSNKQQVMMEWERPYMEASIDVLEPSGDVLEIGFGCGYSATRIMSYKPKSYTVVECDPVVIAKAKDWAKKYPNIPITIVEGKWQDLLGNLGIFDEIYFDDFPLDIKKSSSMSEKVSSFTRINVFIAFCIQSHTRIGSKICWYLNGNPTKIELGSDTMPFINISLTTFSTKIPKTCKYRNTREQLCTIPLVTKTKKYDFFESQRLVLEKIELDRSKIKYLK